MMKTSTALFIGFFGCLVMIVAPSCGTLGAVADAVEQAENLEEIGREAEQASNKLQDRMAELEAALAAYEPIIDGASEEVQEAYDKTKELLGEGRALLADVTDVHSDSLAKATDPVTGEVDWLQYVLLMLMGGGGVEMKRRERKQTLKENDRIHSRVDKDKDKIREIEQAMLKLEHKMELDRVRREASGL